MHVVVARLRSPAVQARRFMSVGYERRMTEWVRQHCWRGQEVGGREGTTGGPGRDESGVGAWLVVAAFHRDTLCSARRGHGIDVRQHHFS